MLHSSFLPTSTTGERTSESDDEILSESVRDSLQESVKNQQSQIAVEMEIGGMKHVTTRPIKLTERIYNIANHLPRKGQPLRLCERMIVCFHLAGQNFSREKGWDEFKLNRDQKDCQVSRNCQNWFSGSRSTSSGLIARKSLWLKSG